MVDTQETLEEVSTDQVPVDNEQSVNEVDDNNFDISELEESPAADEKPEAHEVPDDQPVSTEGEVANDPESGMQAEGEEPEAQVEEVDYDAALQKVLESKQKQFATPTQQSKLEEMNVDPSALPTDTEDEITNEINRKVKDVLEKSVLPEMNKRFQYLNNEIRRS